MEKLWSKIMQTKRATLKAFEESCVAFRTIKCNCSTFHLSALINEHQLRPKKQITKKNQPHSLPQIWQNIAIRIISQNKPVS